MNTYSGIILPGMIQVFGIFLMRQFLQSIPDEVLESARVDGASELRILRSIILPLAAPGHGDARDLHVPRGVERLPVAADRDRSTTPCARCRSAWRLLTQKNTVNWGDTMAGTALAAGPMIVVFLMLQRRFIEGLTAGAVKG